MRMIVHGLALVGAAALVATGLFLLNVFSSPTACAITGSPIRFAEPASASSTNRDLVVQFYTEVILDGRLDRAADYLRADYIQHNPSAGQGLQGFVAFFERMGKSLDALGATRRGEITMVVSDGDLVSVHMTTVIAGRARASFRAIDTFRVEDGRIVEHWDAIQPCDMRSALLFAFAG